MNEVVKQASAKQLKWLGDLLRERATGGWPEGWRQTADRLRAAYEACAKAGYGPESLNVFLATKGRLPVSHQDFQQLLPKLQDSPKKVTSDREVAHLPMVQVEDGVYKVGNDIFKVKHSKNHRQWAHKLHLEEPDCGGCTNGEPCVDGPCPWVATFKYAGTPAKHGITPEHKLSYEDAKAFGALYNICCCCGRLLTNELSVYLGIGPVCGDREFGGEFKFIIHGAKIAIQEKENA